MNVKLHNIQEFNVVPEECISYIGKYVTLAQNRVDSERAIEECMVYLSISCNLKKDPGYLILMIPFYPLSLTSRNIILGNSFLFSLFVMKCDT